MVYMCLMYYAYMQNAQYYVFLTLTFLIRARLYICKTKNAVMWWGVYETYGQVLDWCPNLLHNYTTCYYTSQTTIWYNMSSVLYHLQLPSQETPWILSSQSKSKSVLLYGWQFAANEFILSWSPLRLMTRDYFQLNPCGHCPYVTSSLMGKWGCFFWICLAFHQVYIWHI
jgi:hypothetical protein